MFIRAKKKQACFLPKLFEPRGINDLVRLGSDHDGGYVVSADAVASSRHLLSFGLGGNCDFEFDFAAMARLDTLTCYDASVEAGPLRGRYALARLFSIFRPEKYRRSAAYYRQYRSMFVTGRRAGFSHVQQDAGSPDSELPLAKAIERVDPAPGRLFLKADTGGTEYDFLDQIIEANECLSGLVIVFRDAPERLREIEVFVDMMREFMTVDNTAADNSAGMTGVGIPNVIEMSFSAKFPTEPHIPIAGASTRYQVLSAPNDPAMVEYEIFYVD